MTEGTLVVIENDKIYEYPTLRGDMYPKGRGQAIILSYLAGKLKSVEDVNAIYDSILNELERERDLELAEYSPDADVEVGYPDWVYVINNTDKTRLLRHHEGPLEAEANCLSVFSFEKFAFRIPRIKEGDLLKLVLRGKQIQIVIDALDQYCRLHLGQLDVICFNMRLNFGVPKKQYIHSYWQNLLGAIRDIIFKSEKMSSFGWSGSYGIGNPEVKTEGKLAYDMEKAIESTRAYFEHPNGGLSTIFNLPLELTSIPLPKVKAEMDGNEIAETMLLRGEHFLVLMDALESYCAYCGLRFGEMLAKFKPDNDAVALLDILSSSVRKEFGNPAKDTELFTEELIHKIIHPFVIETNE